MFEPLGDVVVCQTGPLGREDDVVVVVAVVYSSSASCAWHLISSRLLLTAASASPGVSDVSGWSPGDSDACEDDEDDGVDSLTGSAWSEDLMRPDEARKLVSEVVWQSELSLESGKALPGHVVVAMVELSEGHVVAIVELSEGHLVAGLTSTVESAAAAATPSSADRSPSPCGAEVVDDEVASSTADSASVTSLAWSAAALLTR